MLKQIFSVGIALLGVSIAQAHNPKSDPKNGEARYIANEAVMISQGDTKILFDPLPLTGFGTYPDVPEKDVKAMMAGTAPYDGVDAVFISHAHRDHFSAEAMNSYMARQTETRLVAPLQAIAMMIAAPGWDDAFKKRIAPIKLNFGSAPVRFQTDTLDIEAVRIPHSGWPGRADIENIVYRITLNDLITVAHMGDADINPVHYKPLAESHWSLKKTDLALPPYWIYMVPDGERVLEIMNVRESVGIHVPIEVPAVLKTSGGDFFHINGETRVIEPAHQSCAPVTFDKADFTVCTVPRDADIRLFLNDGQSKPYGSFSKLDDALAAKGETLSLAMNGGMYHDDRRPVGHYVENGTAEQSRMTRASKDNFGLLPNGVFYVDDTGPAVMETQAFKAKGLTPRFATQSGPMLVIDGALHPRFRKNSTSRKRRNGIGVTEDQVYFVISEAPVNFHHFGRLFRDHLKTPNALYLDGVISRLYDAQSGRNDPGLRMGPIVGVVDTP